MITPAFVRAYTEKPDGPTVGSKWRPPKKQRAPRYQLIFDCETTTDASQALRFGVFQVREHGRLKSEGLFFDPLTMSKHEVDMLKRFAEHHKLWIGDVERFRRDVFLRCGFHAHASIIGFNLPFDLARIAKSSTEARGNMRGGFSFSFDHHPAVPNVRVKHLSARAALIDFAKPAEQIDGRGMRNRGFSTKPHRGTFVDVKTLAAALLSKSCSLASLCRELKIENSKQETDEHGGPLSVEYIGYARRDVQATWECYDALNAKFREYGLSVPISSILSEASIGKATLSEMQVKPLLKCQPNLRRSDFGTIMATYYGGRAEIRIRKQITEVILTDFKSMYPTVNGLMDLWRFIIANGYTQYDSTHEIQALLDDISLADLQNRETWKSLHTLVKLKPANDVLPLRTQYSKPFDKTKDNLTIGLNHMSSELPMWYALSDVIASKLQTGRTPKIEKAITYVPGPVQEGLKPYNLFNNSDYRIDPCHDDLFTKLINLRDLTPKSKPENKALKILANSTCYGILVEVLRDNAPKKEAIDVFGVDGFCAHEQSEAIEEPGKYFHPLLATLITSAARLMLSITERLGADRGLSWAFCDTDSLALARPDGMARKDFRTRVQEVVDWFGGLNPYDKQGSILQVEDVNYDPQTNRLCPLYCYAVSAKRYTLFNQGDEDVPIIRKASAHGLGHLIAPYTGPLPHPELGSIGVNLWQHDVWQAVLRAVLNNHPNQIQYDYHPALQQPAFQRYGATSPQLLKWMKHFNNGKSYRECVKPFGFMMAPLARTGAFASVPNDRLMTAITRGAPPKKKAAKPISTFDRDLSQAAGKVIDRETGETVSIDQLRTTAEALALFHLSTEDKFENGAPWDTGSTKRRHVHVTEVTLIGKEANKVGDAGEIDPVIGAVAKFSQSRAEVQLWVENTYAITQQVGEVADQHGLQRLTMIGCAVSD